LDDELNAAYRFAKTSRGNQQHLKDSQRQWLEEVNRCADEACIAKMYHERIALLEGSDGADEEGEGGDDGEQAALPAQEGAGAGVPSDGTAPSAREQMDPEEKPVGNAGSAQTASGWRLVVSSSTAEGGFIDNGDGTISDKETGLMWEKKSNNRSVNGMGSKYTWSALTTEFLNSLNSGSGFAGYTDWRIPSIEELDTLRNYRTGWPHVYPAFNSACVPGCAVTTCSCTQPDYYWSTTTFQGWPQDAWGVPFGRVNTDHLNKEHDSNYARAVRSGALAPAGPGR